MTRVFLASSEFSVRGAGLCTVEQSVERQKKKCITGIMSFMVTESLLPVKVITVLYVLEN